MISALVSVEIRNMLPVTFCIMLNSEFCALHFSQNGLEDLQKVCDL